MSEAPEPQPACAHSLTPVLPSGMLENVRNHLFLQKAVLAAFEVGFQPDGREQLCVKIRILLLDEPGDGCGVTPLPPGSPQRPSQHNERQQQQRPPGTADQPAGDQRGRGHRSQDPSESETTLATHAPQTDSHFFQTPG